MKIKPDTKILDLAGNDELLGKLTGAELVVYIKLVAHTVKAGKKFKIKNELLAPVGERNVPRAMKGLAEHGLIRLEYDDYRMRSITVL